VTGGGGKLAFFVFACLGMATEQTRALCFEATSLSGTCDIQICGITQIGSGGGGGHISGIRIMTRKRDYKNLHIFEHFLCAKEYYEYFEILRILT
jgi:hypothetical protein